MRKTIKYWKLEQLLVFNLTTQYDRIYWTVIKCLPLHFISNLQTHCYGILTMSAKESHFCNKCILFLCTLIWYHTRTALLQLEVQISSDISHVPRYHVPFSSHFVQLRMKNRAVFSIWFDKQSNVVCMCNMG